MSTKIEILERREKYKEEKFVQKWASQERRLALGEQKRQDEIKASKDGFWMLNPETMDAKNK